MGPLIKDWLEPFMARHAMKFHVTDWPQPRTDEWHDFKYGWLQAFIKRKITEAEAEDAAAALFEDPPRFGLDHLPAILKRIDAARAMAAASGSKELAAQSSDKCPYCGGNGLRQVFAPLPDDVDRNGRRIPESVSAYCICPYGRWVQNNHLNTCPDVHKRTPDLRRVLDGRSYWRLCEHGTEPDEAEKEFRELARVFDRMAFPSQPPAPSPSQGRPVGRKK